MSAPPDERAVAASRQQVAAEVLELGGALFDAVIDVAAAQRPTEAPDPPYPEAELRAAADQFFAALRLLLGLEPGEDAKASGSGAEPPPRVEARGGEERA